MKPSSRAPRSFTLIELLTVMAIIAILATLTVGAASYAMKKGGMSRAQGEIAGMSTALERYKVDNGGYPATTAIAGTTEYIGTPASYVANAAVLFSSLSGTTTYGAAATGPAYYPFTARQVKTNTVPNYAADPFHSAYGFTTDTVTSAGTSTNVLHNVGFFDIWSTGGQTTTTNSAQWATSWSNN